MWCLQARLEERITQWRTAYVAVQQCEGRGIAPGAPAAQVATFATEHYDALQAERVRRSNMMQAYLAACGCSGRFYEQTAKDGECLWHAIARCLGVDWQMVRALGIIYMRLNPLWVVQHGGAYPLFAVVDMFRTHF